MKSSIIKFLLLSSTTVFLLACSTAIKHVIVSPELSTGISDVYQQKQVQLRFTDLRRSNHIVQILRLDEPAQLYSSQQPIVDIVEQSLTSALKANGLQVTSLAANKIEVIIDNALINVQQELLKYSANNQMDFRVVINNASGTLTKSFKITGKSNGPLKADIAVLERDFNQQLAKLLTQIVRNQEIQEFIK
tara:strand:- start:160 stop:732 length:573 start_codon:yes stop_codon:yes gene_type:complete